MSSILRLKEYLENILRRPAMYGVNSVEDIALIVRGYKQACVNSDFKEVAIFLDNFHEYVRTELEDVSTQSWEKIIRFQSGGSLDSIRLFSDLYSGFLTRSARP